MSCWRDKHIEAVADADLSKYVTHDIADVSVTLPKQTQQSKKPDL